MAEMALTSTAFEDGEGIPRRHTCDGDDLSPPLAWGEQPPETQSLALVVDDPDAPGGTFTHWLAWGFDAATSELAEGEARPRDATTSEPAATGDREKCVPLGADEFEPLGRKFVRERGEGRGVRLLPAGPGVVGGSQRAASAGGARSRSNSHSSRRASGATSG